MGKQEVGPGKLLLPSHRGVGSGKRVVWREHFLATQENLDLRPDTGDGFHPCQALEGPSLGCSGAEPGRTFTDG